MQRPRVIAFTNKVNRLRDGLVPVVLALVCVVASWVPAYRAIRIDVATALRYE